MHANVYHLDVLNVIVAAYFIFLTYTNQWLATRAMLIVPETNMDGLHETLSINENLKKGESQGF